MNVLPAGKNGCVLSLAALHDKFQEGKLITRHIGDAVHRAQIYGLCEILGVISPLRCDTGPAILFLLQEKPSRLSSSTWHSYLRSVTMLYASA